MSESLRQIVETAFEKRADITPSTVERSLRQAIDDVIGLLDSGQARVAEKVDGTWKVNEWLFQVRPSDIARRGCTL
jgi:2,3,4,5-tetrahydropyridine-2-carboxylate N-succinyltransferase